MAEELVRLSEVDLETALKRMVPEVREYMLCGARQAAICGGFRSGKTIGACAWALLMGWQLPGSLALIGRLNMPALKDTTRRTFLELCPPEWIADWKESENRLLLKNGSEYVFRHLDLSDASLAGHIRGLVLNFFLVDQAEEISEGTYLTLLGRLSRQVVDPRTGRPAANYARVVLNPAGRDWNWKRFFDPERNEKLKLCEGFVVPTTANAPNLDPQYLQDLLTSYPPEWQERFIYGSFNEFADTIYKEFSHSAHVYDEDRPPAEFEGTEIPSSWPVIVGIDIGGADPWALVFAACAPSGNVYVYDESGGPGVLVSDIAAQFHQKTAGREVEGVAFDYENRQAVMELAEHRVMGQNAIKAVQPGIFKVAQYLHPTPGHESALSGRDPGPWLYISSRCSNLIASLGSYRWKKDRTGNHLSQPGHEHSHYPDALRYALHTFRPEPLKRRENKGIGEWKANPDLNAMSQLYWHEVDKREQEKGERRSKWTRPGCLRRQKGSGRSVLPSLRGRG